MLEVFSSPPQLMWNLTNMISFKITNKIDLILFNQICYKYIKELQRKNPSQLKHLPQTLTKYVVAQKPFRSKKLNSFGKIAHVQELVCRMDYTLTCHMPIPTNSTRQNKTNLPNRVRAGLRARETHHYLVRALWTTL